MSVDFQSNVVNFGHAKAAKFGVATPQALHFSGVDSVRFGNTVKFGNDSEAPKAESAKPEKAPHNWFSTNKFFHPTQNFLGSIFYGAVASTLIAITGIGAIVAPAGMLVSPVLWILSAMGVGRGGDAAETPAAPAPAVDAGAAPDAKHAAGTTTTAPQAPAEVAKTESATADALTAIKAALGNDDTLKKVLIARLTGQKLEKAPLGEERATQALVAYIANLSNAERISVINTLKDVKGPEKLTLLNEYDHEFDELKALFGKKAGRNELEVLAKEGGGYYRVSSGTSLDSELDAIALATVLDRHNHLAAVVSGNRTLGQQLRSCVEEGYEAYSFKPMSHEDFNNPNKLDDKDRAAHKASFNQQKTNLIAQERKQQLTIEGYQKDIEAVNNALHNPRNINPVEGKAIMDAYIGKKLEIAYGLAPEFENSDKENDFIRSLIGQIAKTKRKP